MASSSHQRAGGTPYALAGKAPPASFLRWLLTGNLLAVSILLALVGLVLSHDKAAYREQVTLATRNLAQVLEQNIAALIAKTDVSLQTIAHEISRQGARSSPDDQAVEDLLARQQALLPELAFLRVTDAEGSIRYGHRGLPAHRAGGVADRDVYLEARQNVNPGLIIEGPIQLRTNRKWVVFMGRRLNRPDGSFQGVVYAAIEVEHFQRLFSSMDLGAGSAVALRTADLRLVTRHPATPQSTAAIGTATVPAELGKALEDQPLAGNYIARSSVDHEERIASYYRIGQHPLYILVALATANYLGPWQAEAVKIAILTALLILVMALSSWMAYRLWCRQWLAAEALQASEQAAKKANALLQEAVDSIAIGFSIYDPDDRLVICNEAYRNFYPTSRHMIVPGAGFEDLIRYGARRGQYPEAAGRVEAWVEEQMERHLAGDGAPQEQELDGNRHLLIVEYRTPSGHLVGNRMDITELRRHRRHLEQLVEARTAELRASMAQFRILIEQAPAAMAMLDRDLTYLAVSRRWQQEYGRGLSDLVGRRHCAVHPDLPERWKSTYRAALAGTTLRNDEDLWTHADGSEQWLRWAVYPWIDGCGQIGGIIIATEDISDRKKTEAALAEEREARQQILEHLVATRTDELVAANKELQGFTYAASHDLKAPLGRINSFSTLLERNYRDRLEGDGLLFLDFICRNATRMAILIDDLLAHAQIEQKILDLQPVDLREMVRDVLEERQAEIRQGGAEIRSAIPALAVRANPHGLARVLRNLLENALKYSSRSRPPVVEIGARQEGGRCRLWVRDNGIGFDMVYHDRIFELFRRLHTYEEFPGSGIGLALVKKAMERMDGRVWAESAPGQGAVFYLELAAIDAARPPLQDRPAI